MAHFNKSNDPKKTRIKQTRPNKKPKTNQSKKTPTTPNTKTPLINLKNQTWGLTSFLILVFKIFEWLELNSF